MSKWVNFKDIKSQVSIEMILGHYGLLDQFKKKRDNLVGACPIHKGSNKSQFHVSLAKNNFNCFGDCHEGGNILDFVAKMEGLEIREAGFGVPDSPNINGFTSTFTVTDNGGANSPDQLTILGGFTQMGTTAAAAIIGNNIITINYTGGAQFDTATMRYISFMGLQYSEITSISGTSNPYTLTLNSSFSKPFPAGIPVYLVEDVTYQINANLDLTRRGNIDMNPPPNPPPNNVFTVTIAGNIEDIQFDTTTVADSIGVHILARTAIADPKNFLNQGIKPDIFADLDNDGVDDINDAPGVVGTDEDSFRRRLWSTNVHYRNQ